MKSEKVKFGGDTGWMEYAGFDIIGIGIDAVGLLKAMKAVSAVSRELVDADAIGRMR